MERLEGTNALNQACRRRASRTKQSADVVNGEKRPRHAGLACAVPVISGGVPARPAASYAL
jgi:hypothetical protein